MSYSFSIIVPVYNEINIIEKFIKKLVSTFKDYNSKIIFINDGSSDGTTEWLKNNLIKFFSNNNFELIDLKKIMAKAMQLEKE